MSELTDVQSEPGDHGASIDRVGIKGMRVPIVVMDKANARQQTVAEVNMFVDLPRQFRGTHMSRFVEILYQYRGRMSRRNIRNILKDIRQKLVSESSRIEITFPYFIQRQAPVSLSASLMEYTCRIVGQLIGDSQFIEQVEVNIPVMNLCPCSKELSVMGPHNQRSYVRISIISAELIWIEDIVSIAEEEASSPLYSLLKREDEKYVCDYAYANPRFVEDVVRRIMARLTCISAIEWCSVESENLESIHNHNAYAYLEYGVNRLL